MRVWTSSSPLLFLLPREFQNVTGPRDPHLISMSRKLFLGGMRAAREAGAVLAGALRNPDSEKSLKLTWPMPGRRSERNSWLSGAMMTTSVRPDCTLAQLYSCASLTMMPLASFHPAGGAAMVDDGGYRYSPPPSCTRIPVAGKNRWVKSWVRWITSCRCAGAASRMVAADPFRMLVRRSSSELIRYTAIWPVSP